MTILNETTLDQAFSLGAGRTIRPPMGWTAQGFISGNDTLKLRPASQARWSPAGSDRLSLHWNKSMSPLSVETAEYFSEILRKPLGIVTIEELEPLFPELIRIPLIRITQARVTSLPRYGPFLEIDYFIAEKREAGLVYFAPTERFEFGEYQVLAYEGQEPAFTTFLPVARKSIRTFCDGSDFSIPARRTGLVSRKTGSTKKTIPRKKTAAVRAAAPGGLLYEYTLKAGETIKTIVRGKWPDLTEEEAKQKVKEIYAVNRARGNAIFAWTLQEGAVILLPMN
jgi:hypothetical protein